MELIFDTKLQAVFILFNEDLVRNLKNANMKDNTAKLLFLGYSTRRR